MRWHGARLHNFLRYGETDNVGEFDQGATQFLPGGKFKDWVGGSREAAREKLNEWNEEDPKIVCIVGQTDGDEARSNASGKSTFASEAVVYALTGKLVRDFKNKDSAKGKSTRSIIPDHKAPEDVKESYVDLLFSAENELWVIRRGRKNNKQCSMILELRCLTNVDLDNICCGHRSDDTLEFLNRLISMGYEGICNSICFGQGDDGKFMTGSRADRSNIITDVLNLHLDEYLKEIRENRKKPCKKKIEEVDAQLSLLKSQLEGAGSPDSLREEIAGTEVVKKEAIETIAECEKTLADLRSDLDKNSLAGLEGEVKMSKQAIDAESARHDQNVESKRKECETLEKQAENTKASVARVELRIKNLNSQKENAEKELSKIDIDSIKSELDIVNKAKEAMPKRKEQVESLKSSRSTLGTEMALVEKEISEYLSKIKAFELKQERGEEVVCEECESLCSPDHFKEKIEQKQDHISVLKTKAGGLKSKISKVDEEIVDVNKRISHIEEYLNKESSFLLKLQNHETLLSKIESASKDIESAKKELESLSSGLNVEFQIKGLKESIAKASAEKASSIEPLVAKKKEAENKLLSGQRAVALINAKIETATQKQKDAERRKGGVIAAKARYETQLKEVLAKNEKLEELTGELSKLKTKMEHIKWLEARFSSEGIQAQFVAKYLPVLNKYIADCIDVLFDGNVVMEIEPHTLDIKLSGKTSKHREGLSGGEATLYRLALNIALGKLSFVRMKDVPENICIDEALAEADAHNKFKILSLLKHLSKDFKTITIISHDPKLMANVKNRIIVNRVNDTSRIERQMWDV